MDVQDRTLADLIPVAEGFLQNGFQIFLKWTCPKCGERCASTEANKVCTGGYLHETRLDGSPCGELYRGELYGLLAIRGDGVQVWP